MNSHIRENGWMEVENVCENGKLESGFAHVTAGFADQCSICDKWRLARRSLQIN